MKIKPLERAIVVFESLEEVEAAWDIIRDREEILDMKSEIADVTLQETSYDIEDLLELFGFKEANVTYDLGYFQGSGASFVADEFYLPHGKEFDFEELREKRGYKEILEAFKEVYDEAEGLEVYARCFTNEYRTHYVHCNTVEWEVEECEFYEQNRDAVPRIEAYLNDIECAVERELEKVYNGFMLEDDWVKEAIVENELEFELSIDEIEIIQKKLERSEE